MTTAGIARESLKAFFADTPYYSRVIGIANTLTRTRMLPVTGRGTSSASYALSDVLVLLLTILTAPSRKGAADALRPEDVAEKLRSLRNDEQTFLTAFAEGIFCHELTGRKLLGVELQLDTLGASLIFEDCRKDFPGEVVPKTEIETATILSAKLIAKLRGTLQPWFSMAAFD